MMRRAICGIAIGAMLVLCSVTPAFASFGFQNHSFESLLSNADGSPDMQAGSHPFAVTTGFKFNTKIGVTGGPVPDEDVKDIVVDLPAGLVGNASATPKCTIQQFNTRNRNELFSGASCPDNSQIGFAEVELTLVSAIEPAPIAFGIYNLVAPPGVPAEFGLNPDSVPIVLVPEVRTGGDYGVTVVSKNTNQTQRIFGVKTTFWGVPSDPSHEGFRGECLGPEGSPFAGVKVNVGECPVGFPGKPFLRLPTSCPSDPQPTTIHADSWQNPVQSVELEGVSEVAFNHYSAGDPVGIAGCERLDFSPEVSVVPTSRAASTPTGVVVGVSLPQNENANGLGESDLKEAVVTLPPGMSISPSAATGLAACSDTPEPGRPEGQIALHSAASR